MLMIFQKVHHQVTRGKGNNHACKNINWLLAIQGLG